MGKHPFWEHVPGKMMTAPTAASRHLSRSGEAPDKQGPADVNEKCIVEVRDSRTGYLIPVRYGLGLWSDGKIVGAPPSPPPSASSGNSGRHSGQETICGVFHMILGSW